MFISRRTVFLFRSLALINPDVREFIHPKVSQICGTPLFALIRQGGIALDCLVGAGYSSSLERDRRTGSVQFSSVSPFTRPNSAVLFVTSLIPRLRA